MATLAIEGHKTRGKEVIEILEMLGGDNKYHINITECDLLYTIREGDDVIIGTYPNSSISQIYTLEEFLEKFPYKIGDKIIEKDGVCGNIISAYWTDNTVLYHIDSHQCWRLAEDLQLIKEETMGENNEKSANHVFDTEVITFDIAQRDKYELDLQGKFQVVLREGKYYVERIKPKYPKTYEECCKVLGYSGNYNMILTTDVDNKLFNALYRLKVCRDAYWKIYGEEKGLGKAWEYDISKDEFSYAISYQYGHIQKNEIRHKNAILAFPTKEMRDAYKENFDNDIEACKEFL